MFVWEESGRADTGMDPAGLDRAWELARARGTAGQLCVLRHGRVVLDRSFGRGPDALFLTFSAGKPLTALLVHKLAERGALSLDERVAAYWPEFGRNGKEAVTVRQVLQHRAGVPVARSLLRDAWAMTDWDRSVRAVERARPVHPPGEVAAYHIISYGYILGELLHRVSGTPVRELLRTEFLDPLGLRDIHLGLTAELRPRAVPLVSTSRRADRARRVFFNRRAVRRAVVPAAGVSSTARDLARFYQMLLRGGELDGVRVLRPDSVAEARRLSTAAEGDLDHFLRMRIRWSHGFQLGAAGPDPRAGRPMGQLGSPQAFGHNGSSICLAWADPTRDLVLVHFGNLLAPPGESARHESAISDAVIAACG
ncbi:serine hydrolase domain-containing protein [Streptacidiphilus sp. N1-12]|uniref:Serine hydrolase domain-containing protein n=2 Tax=Streptacidiphilus alkalitolerans TaxID=3342712 RepID=A0ABV6WL89_9ACTN